MLPEYTQLISTKPFKILSKAKPTARDASILGKHLHVVKESSGDCPQAEDHWRAEPGGNGLALLSQTPRELVMCQHGARRLI